MAKEKTNETTNRSACEEYVVEQLKKTQKENQVLEHNLELSKQELRELYERHNLLVGMILAAFSRDDSYVEEDDDGLASVYVLGHYIGLYDINRPKEIDNKLMALASLINKAKRIPFRD